MAKKLKLTKVLNILSPDGTQVDFADFDKQISTLKSQLKEKIQVKTLQDVQDQLERFKNKVNFQPLIDSVEKLKSSLTDSFETESQRLSDEIEQKTLELSRTDKARVDDIRVQIVDLQSQLSSLEERRKTDIQKVYDSIPNLSQFEDRVNEMMLEVSSRLDTLETEETQEEAKEVEDWQKKIDGLRIELMSRMGSLGGGNMNRKITFGGVDYLTRYTDINYKAGSNVTFTVSQNDTTKMVDVTVSATGGGGGGTVRVISNVSTNTVAAFASQTDYVYLCSGTMTLTMPDATAGNTNLYTIKNVGTGIVTINTTLAQTIDGDTTITMPVRYTSVDLISDSANWNVT